MAAWIRVLIIDPKVAITLCATGAAMDATDPIITIWEMDTETTITTMVHPHHRRVQV